MGHTWQVYAWIYNELEYSLIYEGESLWKAIRAARNAKKHWQCVKIMWR